MGKACGTSEQVSDMTGQQGTSPVSSEAAVKLGVWAAGTEKSEPGLAVCPVFCLLNALPTPTPKCRVVAFAACWTDMPCWSLGSAGLKI